MKSSRYLHFINFIFLCALGAEQTQADHQAKPQDATTAIIQALNDHDVVIIGEWHGDKQEHEWLRRLVSTPEFADRVDDIVMEFGNSLYQKSVDRYISGENVPLEQVQKAWRNTVGAIGAPSPVYALLYQTVRETNQKRGGQAPDADRLRKSLYRLGEGQRPRRRRSLFGQS